MKSMKENRFKDWYIYGTLFLFSFLVTFFMLPFGFVNLPELKPGQISPVDIRSPVTVTVEDRAATRKLKETARKGVVPRVRIEKKAEREALKSLKSLRGLSEEEKKLAEKVVSSYYRRGIISSIPEGYTKVQLPSGKKVPVSKYLSVEEAEKGIEEDLKRLLGEEKARLVLRALSGRVKPNVVYDKESTEKLWKEAESKVKPVLVSLRKGELIVKKGEKVSSEAARKIEILRGEKGKGKGLNKYISMFLIAAVLYFSVIRLYRIVSPSAFEFKNIFFSYAVITLDILLIRFFTFVSKLLVESLNLPVEELLIYVPVVTSVVFASMFINKKVAVIHSIPVSVISSFMLSKPEFLFVPVTVGCFFSAFDSRKFKSREVIYASAFKGGVVTLLFQVLVYFYYFGFGYRAELWFQPLLTLFGALITAVVVNGLSPLFVKLFHFTTDIVYMELINLNHPLLRKLILKAPGTYSHSVMVATLAEAAAETIGANALLAKAGGLFHDIGKLKNPQAFIENQQGGINIHDKLPPEKSAAILRSHVEYGEELGKKYGLPEKVIDIIKQHHGTKLMKYFYHKAKELYGDKVDEKKFRYPGPKPQFKESGIVMLADTVEAAVRSMKDKDVDLDKFIHDLIMETVEEGQLSQSGLSLKDIALIEKVFKKVLSGVYHNRIEYPDEEDVKGDSKGDRLRP